MTPTAEARTVSLHWFRRAEKHIAAARVLLGHGDDDTTDAACYHCHEAVATLIKSVLTLYEIVSPRIHDLEFLHRMIPAERRFPADPYALAWISVYGIERYWYPDLEQAARALEIATGLRESAWITIGPVLAQASGSHL